MKRWGWAASIWAVLLLAAPVALAEEGVDKPKPAKKKKGPRKKAGLRGEYAMMANILKLDAETKAKFTEAVLAGAKAMKEWNTANGAKWKELMTARRQAWKKKDQDKIKELTPQFNELRASREKVAAEGKAKIMELLTDEQKAVWEGFVLRRSLGRWFRGIKLTDEQKAQMQTLCEEKAKTLPAATDPKNRRARNQAMNKLRDEIAEKILTDEQREKFKKNLPKRKPRKVKKVKKEAGEVR